jgi:hypothetical protein
MTTPVPSRNSASEPITENEFITRAKRFLTGVGVSPALLDPDTNLVDAGVLDSLLLLAFLAFVEEQRGYEVEPKPEDMIAVRTLRTAYALVRSPAKGGDLERGAREP